MTPAGNSKIIQYFLTSSFFLAKSDESFLDGVYRPIARRVLRSVMFTIMYGAMFRESA